MKQVKNIIKTLIILPLIIGAQNINAEELPSKDQSIDLSVAVGDGIFSGALSWGQRHGIAFDNKLRLGYGVRFSAFTGSELTYITAPANLTADDATIDTLHVDDPLTMGLSAVIHIEYQFNPRLKGGFNIDAIGLGLGPERTTRFETGGDVTEELNASPTPFNLLIMGDYDYGHLKSEFYLAYALRDNLWIKGGMDMTFSEYTTERELTHDNDRFRFKTMMLFAGITFNPF